MSSERAARIEAAIAGWHQRRNAADLLPVLAAGLADPEVRPLVLRGIRLVGRDATDLLSALIVQLDDERDESAAADLAGTIAAVCPDHPVVLTKLRDGGDATRLVLTQVLAAAGAEARGAEATLEAVAARDSDPLVRWHAAGALWSVAGRAGIAFDVIRREPLGLILYDVRDHELIGASWPRLREMWPWFISVIVSIAAEDRARLVDLRSVLESTSQRECLNACRVIYLVEGGAPGLIEPVMRVLRASESFDVFVASCELLAAMGPAASSALRTIEEVKAIVPALWREYAERAIEAIGVEGQAP